MRPNIRRPAGAVLGLILAIVTLTTALAAQPILHLTGSAGAVQFSFPASLPGGVADYVYTNHGSGTLGKKSVVWSYVDRGTAMADGSATIAAAEYTITPLHGSKDKPGKPVVLHVILATYAVHYDDPSAAPCTTGTFDQVLAEGGIVHGTFACVGGVPTGSLDFTIAPARGHGPHDD